VAQTFLQLVLLSVIMVGQNVQAAAADKRAEATFHDASATPARGGAHPGPPRRAGRAADRIAEKIGLDPVPVIDEPVPGIDTPLGAETAAPDQGR